MHTHQQAYLLLLASAALLPNRFCATGSSGFASGSASCLSLNTFANTPADDAIAQRHYCLLYCQHKQEDSILNEQLKLLLEVSLH